MKRNLCKTCTLGMLLAFGLTIGWSRDAAARIMDGTFELDGDATDNPAVAGEDWNRLFPVDAGSAALSKIFITDGRPDATTFTTGSRDNSEISSWRYTPGTSSDKAEILDAFAGLYTHSGNLYLVFGADRYDNSGAANIGFWFFQDAVSLKPDGTFSGLHSTNDLFIVSEFTQGGAVSTIKVYRWVGSGGSDGSLNLINSGADCTTASATDLSCAIVNSASVPSPWPFTAKFGPGNTFPPGTLFEGAINISKLVPGVECFASFLASTRSSARVNASLQDFAIGKLGTCCIDVTKTANPARICGSGTVNYTLVASNCGAFGLSNVRMVDDNGTPNNTADDTIINIGTLPRLTGHTTNLVFAVSGLGSLTNSVTATGSRGNVNVSASAKAVVDLLPPIACSVSGTAQLHCTGQTTEFCAAEVAGATYSWTGPKGFTANTRCTGAIAQEGNYIVTLTAASGCQTSCSRYLAVTQQVACSISPSSAAVCQGQTQQFCAVDVPGATYAWTGPGFASSSRCIDVGAAGTYTVTITDANGCVNTCSATLAVNTVPVATISAPSAVCANSTGQSASVANAGSGASYAWTITNGTITAGQGTPAITWSAGSNGSVTIGVTVTAAGGCSASSSRSVAVRAIPAVSISMNASCATAPGVLTATVTGSTATPFSYVWTGPAAAGPLPNSASINITVAGTYSVIVSDSNGCKGSASRTVGLCLTP